MRTLVNLRVLRSRRRMLLGILAPVLLLEWVAAAALPCAAMGTSGEGVSAHEHGGSIAPAAHARGHAAHAAPDASQHAPCPHCLHAPAGGGDAAAHAACGDAPASKTSDARRISPQLDLALAVPIQVEPYAATVMLDVFVRPHPGGVPPPTRALYLRHCVFLN